MLHNFILQQHAPGVATTQPAHITSVDCTSCLYTGECSIFRSHIFRFQVFFVHHLGSWIKFQKTTLFISAFFVSPIFRFPAFLVVNHVPDTAFPHMDCVAFLVWEKNLRLKRVICGIRVVHQRHASDYVSIPSTPYLCVLYNPRLPHDLQLWVGHICVVGTVMAVRKNRVRSLHDRLKRYMKSKRILERNV
jgi:hypothetical protein